MNNFFNNFDYMNFYNQLTNKNKVTAKNEELYDSYQGFIRGNMFTNLYDPYKISAPYEIRPMNEQADMLTKIDALTFASIDLGLYLDVNPNNKEKINLFNQYREEKNKLVEMYERKFGPLLLSSNSMNNYPWVWDNLPWPWEG